MAERIYKRDINKQQSDSLLTLNHWNAIIDETEDTYGKDKKISE